MAQNGTIEIRLDVSLPDYSTDSVREFLATLATVIDAEFGDVDSDGAEVHEIVGMIAYPAAGGEVPEIAGEVF